MLHIEPQNNHKRIRTARLSLHSKVNCPFKTQSCQYVFINLELGRHGVCTLILQCELNQSVWISNVSWFAGAAVASPTETR